MKKGSFIYNGTKILYKIVLKKDYGNQYKVILKFKHARDLFYKQTSLQSFYSSSSIKSILSRLNDLSESNLIIKVSDSISEYEEERKAEEKFKKLKKEWM